MTSSEVMLLVMCAGVAVIAATSRPRYVDCVDTAECGVGTCCMLGMGRYSIPQCIAHGELGHACIPNVKEILTGIETTTPATLNETLFYPDGQIVQVTNVYRMFCPCAEGLYCSSQSHTCMDQLEDVKRNDIDAF